MSYFTYRLEGMPQAHDYTAFNVGMIRHSAATLIPYIRLGHLGAFEWWRWLSRA